MKNKMKKIVAFLCVLTLSVGAMAAWTPAKEVKATEASTDPTPVYLEGYNHITLKDFGIDEGTTYTETKYVQLKDSNGAPVTGTFDKTLLSLKVKFTQRNTDSYGSLLVMGGDGWNKGFGFRPNKTGEAMGILDFNNDVYPMITDTIGSDKVFQAGVLYASDIDAALGTSGFNFYDEFTLQVSFGYTTEGEQTYLTLTFYVNGKLIKVNERLTAAGSTTKLDVLKMKIASDKKNHGTYIGFEEYSNGGTLKMSSVSVATEETTGPTPVYLPGFKNVTLENFNIPKEATYNEDKYVQLKDNNGTSVVGTFNKSLLSLKVDFTYDSDDRAALMFGGSGWNTGFAFSPNNAGDAVGIFNYFHKTSPMNDDVEKYQPGVLRAAKVNEALGRDDFTFLEPFTLQVSFEYITEGADTYLTLTFYVNGEQIKVDDRTTGTTNNFQSFLKMKVTNSMTNHGNYIGYRKGDGGTLTMSSVVAKNDELNSITWSNFVATKAAGGPIYLNGFKHETLSNFKNDAGEQIADGTYSDKVEPYYLKDGNGSKTKDLDNTIISFKIKYDYTNSNVPIILLGGNANDCGIGIVPSATGKTLQFVNYNQGSGTQMISAVLNNNNVFARVNVDPSYSGGDTGATANALYNIEQLQQGNTNFLFSNGTEFLLQISFEYNETKDKLKLGVYVNGKLMKLEFPDKTTGDKASARIDDEGKVEVSVYYNTETDKSNHGVNADFVNLTNGNITVSSVVPEDVTGITIPNKAFLKAGQKVYVLEESDAITSLNNTSFEGKVTFLSVSDNDVIYYGGVEAESGLRFSACEEGSKLKVLFDDAELYLDAAIAGVTSFLNNEFRLKITTEYADYDVDGDSNDVQLGILINGKLYNNKYLYVYDYTTAGNYVTVDSGEKGIMLCSVTAGLKDVTHNLSQGAYSLATDFMTVTKVMKGDVEIAFDAGLTVSGDYTLYKGDEQVGKVVLYQAGDVCPDGKMDVKDLVAMMKVNANVALTTWAGTMGAYQLDFNETTIINELLGNTPQ